MVEFSERESNLFNAKIGRVNVGADFDEWVKIKEESQALDLDFLRIKISNPDSSLLSKLSVVAPNLYLIGVIRLYKINITPDAAFHHTPVAEFRKVSLADKHLLKEILMKTYTETPLGFFQHPPLSQVFRMDLQLENISSYFADHFSGTEPGKEAYIGYMDGKPIECFASDFNDQHTVITLYAGILQEYRNKSLFKDMIRYYKKLCYDRGKIDAICGARIENLVSQYAMEQESSFCYGHEWVYMASFKN